MDVTKFKNDFNNKKMGQIIDSCLAQKDWFFPNVIRPKPKKMKSIWYLTKIGFLLADPEKGLKVNRNFIPRNQK